MAKRSATPPPPETAASGLFSLLRQSGLGTLVVVCGLLGGTAWFLWQQVHRTVATRGDYQLDLNEIELPPKPAWIRADVRAEALRDASLDPPLSILDDPVLSQRLVKAYGLHPWVSRVEGVQLTYPAHATIKLQYRRPIAMVEVKLPEENREPREATHEQKRDNREQNPEKKRGLLPIDAAGTLLPTRDFDNQQEVLKYPRLVLNVGSPTAPAGTVWENPIVLGGAQIVSALEPLWNRAELDELRWIEDLANVGSITRHYVLVTKEGSILIWGQAPGREHVGELPMADKIAALKRWSEQPDGLKAVTKGSNSIDLRTNNAWPK
jgi:hypothetical protein